MPLNPLKDNRLGPRWGHSPDFRHRRVCHLGFATNVEALVDYIHENPGCPSGVALDWLYTASGRGGKRPPGWGCWYFSHSLGGMGGILWKKGPGHRGGWTLTPRGAARFENL